VGGIAAVTQLVQIMAGAKHGGAEAFFCRLAVGLQRAGQAQHVIIRADQERKAMLTQAGVACSELPFGGVFDFRTRRSLSRLLRDLKPRVVLSWMNRATERTPRGDYVHVARLGGYYDLKYYRRCDHLIGNTEDIVAYLRREGWPAERTHYLPNFVEPKTSAAVPRASLGTPEDAQLLLGIGRLHPVKGFDLLLDALAKLPGVWLWLAGAGPEEEKLTRQARALGIMDRVRFLGWRDDAAGLMASADLLVCPSNHEPLGNVVIEAWAQGLPVLATDSEGPRVLIRPGIDGMLVPRQDVDALTDMIRDLLTQEHVRHALAVAGYETYEQRFSERRVVAAYQDFIARISA